MIYSEIETESDPLGPQRLMLHDLATGSSRLLWDKPTRRPGLSGEQQIAFVADVAIAGDRIAALLGFGDGTWLERYDLAGRPVDDPSDRAIIPGTILEIAISADVAVVGFEPELHRLITEIWAIDLRSGDVVGTWSHAPDGEHLRNLDFDGSPPASTTPTITQQASSSPT